MILNSPYITGSITVTGNANIQGQLTVTGSLSGTATSASYAYTASSAINAFSASNAISSSYSATASFSNDFTVLGNLTVFGTQSVQYITSSQLNISDNVITVNVASPGVRFGGLAVFDSGSLSSEATASLFWDSQNNHWVYQRESGSSYSGGMLISGPRNSGGLGNELGTTACMLLVGQGGDHLTSSMIYHDNARTCFYGNTILACSNNIGSDLNSRQTFTGSFYQTGSIASFSGNFGIGITTPSNKLEVRSTSPSNEIIANFENAVNAIDRYNLIRIGQPSYAAYVGMNLNTYDTAYFSTNANPTSGLGIYYSTANRLGVNVKQPTNELTLVSSCTTTGKGIDFVNYASPSQVLGQLTFEQVGDTLALNHKIAGGGITFSTFDTERMRITSGGNIEIGKCNFTSPNGADRFIGVYGGQDSSLILQDAVQLWELYVNDDFYINRNCTNVLTALRSNGNVGIGMTSAPSKLSVDGSLQINGTITNLGTGTDVYTQSTWYVDVNNQILFENARSTNSAAGTGRTVYFTWRGGPSVGGGVQLQHGTNAWAAYTSDARMKTKVADIENGLDAVMKLNPIKFKWTRELENSKTITGFTAQNVGEAIPDAVFNSWEDEELGDVKSYYQDYLVPYLAKAIQELKAENDIFKSCLGIS
jgi:hypothetical protein